MCWSQKEWQMLQSNGKGEILNIFRCNLVLNWLMQLIPDLTMVLPFALEKIDEHYLIFSL